MPEFIGEPIEVDKQGAEPVAFRWRGSEYRIRRVRQSWFDVRSGPPHSRVRTGWWQRRKRTFYQVETTDGQLLEIYWDRGSVHGDWILFRRLDDESGPTGGGDG
jgi:hypothetical protein